MGLDMAKHLYEKAGFVLTDEKENLEWCNTRVLEQKMECMIPELS